MFFTMQYLEVTCGVFISTKIHDMSVMITSLLRDKLIDIYFKQV